MRSQLQIAGTFASLEALFQSLVARAFSSTVTIQVRLGFLVALCLDARWHVSRFQASNAEDIVNKPVRTNRLGIPLRSICYV